MPLLVPAVNVAPNIWSNAAPTIANLEGESGVDARVLDELLQMGFDRDLSVRALRESNNSLEGAVQLIADWQSRY